MVPIVARRFIYFYSHVFYHVLTGNYFTGGTIFEGVKKEKREHTAEEGTDP